MGFTVVKKLDKSLARAGILETAHGVVETPVFMPVGTQGTVKSLTPQDLGQIGAQIILGNTYHLYLRPGANIIKELGGLHRFMGWAKPIITDSGGFQAFSLGAMIVHEVKKVSKPSGLGEDRKRKVTWTKEDKEKALKEKAPLVSRITEEGVEFLSHLDGSKHLLSPEKSIEVQLNIGADICLVLDELLSPLHSPEYVKESLERTHRWELRSKTYFDQELEKSTNSQAQLFGIVQGVYDQKVREDEARWVAEQGFSGASIGGSFGVSQYWPRLNRPKNLSGRETVDWVASEAINQTMEWVVPILPHDWPKHALGIGEIWDLFECVERGIDMFDCVAPTRLARNGALYISPKSGGARKNKFRLNIYNSVYKTDPNPVDAHCSCYTCQNFSRAYLRHLFLAQELLAYRLASLHNLHFIINLTRKIRESILAESFFTLKNEWLS
jgi:queuine tRNA-ribosyltransferase/7-cyano-7-deazaguanine tRNA-ribosyltransferase